jgi:hypothetical protein
MVAALQSSVRLWVEEILCNGVLDRLSNIWLCTQTLKLYVQICRPCLKDVHGKNTLRVEIGVSETTRILTCPEAIVYICVDRRRETTTTHASFQIRTPTPVQNLGELHADGPGAAIR